MQTKSRILICGGRDFKDYDLFTSSMLTAVQWFDKDFVIIQGGATGADRMAMMWAINRGAPMMAMPANWTYYSQAARSIRNGWMLRFGLPDLVIAFPGGTGTADMVAQAKEWGCEVWQPV
jgi:predicted Rossmann-fold nucleotide-binding protein